MIRSVLRLSEVLVNHDFAESKDFDWTLRLDSAAKLILDITPAFDEDNYSAS